MGIEPTSSAWKAEMLPLYHTRKSCGTNNTISIIADYIRVVNIFVIFLVIFYRNSSNNPKMMILVGSIIILSDCGDHIIVVTPPKVFI